MLGILCGKTEKDPWEIALLGSSTGRTNLGPAAFSIHILWTVLAGNILGLWALDTDLSTYN